MLHSRGYVGSPPHFGVGGFFFAYHAQSSGASPHSLPALSPPRGERERGDTMRSGADGGCLFGTRKRRKANATRVGFFLAVTQPPPGCSTPRRLNYANATKPMLFCCVRFLQRKSPQSAERTQQKSGFVVVRCGGRYLIQGQTVPPFCGAVPTIAHRTRSVNS